MLSFIKARNRLSSDPRQDSIERFQNHHMLTQLSQHGSRLKPDVTAADNDHLAHVGKFSQHAVNIRAAAHRVHTQKVRARAR